MGIFAARNHFCLEPDDKALDLPRSALWGVDSFSQHRAAPDAAGADRHVLCVADACHPKPKHANKKASPKLRRRRIPADVSFSSASVRPPALIYIRSIYMERVLRETSTRNSKAQTLAKYLAGLLPQAKEASDQAERNRAAASSADGLRLPE